MTLVPGDRVVVKTGTYAGKRGVVTSAWRTDRVKLDDGSYHDFKETSLAPESAPTPAPVSAVSWKNGWGSYGHAKLPGADWRPYADESFFNTPLPAGPKVLAGSQAMVDHLMGFGGVNPLPVNPNEEWSHPVYFSSPSDPEYRIYDNKHAPDHSPINGLSLRIPPGAEPANGADAHMCIIDQQTGWEWDLTIVQDIPAGGGTATIGWGGRTKIDGFGGGRRADITAACAACTGLIGGIIRFPELASGRIEHALFIVIKRSNGGKVYPGWDVEGASDPGAPATGQWFQLALSPAQIDALTGIHAWQKTILKAAAKYGLLVGDEGSNGAFEFQVEGRQTWSSMGQPNPWVAWAEARSKEPNGHVENWGGEQWVLDPGAGLPSGFWEEHLRVIEPSILPGYPG